MKKDKDNIDYMDLVRKTEEEEAAEDWSRSVREILKNNPDDAVDYQAVADRWEDERARMGILPDE